MSTNAHLILTAEDKTQAAFRSLNQSIGGVVSQVSGLKHKLLGIGIVSGFVGLIESAIDASAEIEKLSKTIGASTESLSQFKHVAELAHVPFESLTKGWRLMEKNVSLAAEGLGAAKDALHELGISATELKKLAPEDQFAVLADALEQVKNPADKVRMAMQIFGRAGADLIPIMAGGSKAIEAVRAEADKLGLTLDETSTHELASAHEAIVRLESAFRGAKNTLAIAFAPILAKVADGLGVVLPKAANLTAKAFLWVEKTITLALASISVAVNKVLSLFAKLPGSFGKAFQAAAETTKQFSQTLLNHASHCEQALNSLNQAQQTYHAMVQQTGKTLIGNYHPALQAISGQIQNNTTSLKRFTETEKSYQKQLEKGQELAQAMRTPQEIYRDQLKETNQLLQTGVINYQTYSRAIHHYQKELWDANGVSQLLADQKQKAQEHINTLANLFRNGLFSFLEGGFKGLVKSFENALSAMAADLAASEISHLLFGSLGNSAAKCGGSLLGQFFSNGFGKLFGFNNFGGFRAEGGQVTPGKSYIVGEKGAEIFMPNQSGTILTHEQLSKNQIASNIVMHIHTPDAQSFRLSRSHIAQEMGLALQRASQVRA